MARILIVDDDPIMVSTLEYTLRGEPHTLQAASSGEEALRIITQRAYDLIILDVALPGMDGLETLRRIRNFNAHLPVIMLTGYGHAADATRALELGANDYVLKPVDPESFISRVETTLKKSRFLEEKLSEKEIQSNIRLAAGLCHHLNNMLCVITGRTSMVLDDPELPPRLREEIAAMAGVTEDMSTLMERLSSISHADTSIENGVIPVQELDEVIKEFKRHPHLQISVDRGQGVYRPALSCNRARLRQLFRELLQNAADAVMEEGSIHVTASVGGLPDTPCVNLVIRDHGPGIAAHQEAMIFQPFFSTRQAIGLGLPVALSVCAQLGGRLSVQNAASGTGVEVRVSIPADPPLSEAAQQKDPPVSAPAIRKVMIIDDDQAIVTLGSRMLVRIGFEVETEMDGEASIEKAAHIAEWADLLLLDIMLGSVNGVEVYRAIRQHNSRIPIIFMSGFSINSMMENMLQQDPYTRFISKPFDLNRLKDTMAGVGSMVGSKPS